MKLIINADDLGQTTKQDRLRLACKAICSKRAVVCPSVSVIVMGKDMGFLCFSNVR